jgi:hypothetical protein
MASNSEECQCPHRAVVPMLMMMFCIERMNCSNTVTPKSEDAMKYVSQDIPITFPNINSVPTKTNKIKKKSLMSDNCCGYYETSAKLLKTCIDYVSLPLSMCNHSVALGIFLKGLTCTVTLQYKRVKSLPSVTTDMFYC